MTDTVTIDAVSYDVYDSTADVGQFLNADPRFATLWSAASADNKSRAMVIATRFLESLPWAGSKTSSSQDLEWPRSGLIDWYGEAVATDAIPTDVLDAFAILSGMVIRDNEALSAVANSGNIKAVAAGLSNVKFFQPQKNVLTPVEVSGLLKWFLRARKSVTGGVVSGGNDGETSFDDDFTHNGSGIL